MPYFIICPIYALLLVGLLGVSVVLLFFKRFRHFSSYLALGALGTIPGFIIGNVVFWLSLSGVAFLLHKPTQEISSSVVDGIATVGLLICFVVGLALANIIGCAVGFLGGIWIHSKFTKTRAKKIFPRT